MMPPTNRLKMLAAGAFMIFAACHLTIANAADVYYSTEGTLNFEGEIRRGDAERVVVAALTAPTLIYEININSNGGDLAEAMRIVSLVKDAHWNIEVMGHGRVCVSACFFIFIAGERRSAGGTDGIAWPQEFWSIEPGVVGVHRPYLKDPLENPESPKNQEALMRKAREYLNEAGIAQYLVDEMMSRPSNDIYWLKRRDLEFVGTFSPGIEEALIANCGYKRSAQAVAERRNKETETQVNFCVAKFLGDRNFRIQKLYVAKLRSGWRPWKK